MSVRGLYGFLRLFELYNQMGLMVVWHAISSLKFYHQIINRRTKTHSSISSHEQKRCLRRLHRYFPHEEFLLLLQLEAQRIQV